MAVIHRLPLSTSPLSIGGCSCRVHCLYHLCVGACECVRVVALNNLILPEPFHVRTHSLELRVGHQLIETDGDETG